MKLQELYVIDCATTYSTIFSPLLPLEALFTLHTRLEKLQTKIQKPLQLPTRKSQEAIKTCSLDITSTRSFSTQVLQLQYTSQNSVESRVLLSPAQGCPGACPQRSGSR